MLADRLATVQSMLLPIAGLAQRATLLLNHVLAREPAAVERLKAHAGKRIELRATNTWWPLLPLVIEVTRAGLFEIDAAAQRADLTLTLDFAHPLADANAWLAGDRRALALHGDAALAAEVDWLLANLRWDIEDELERVVGPIAARGIARAGSGAAALGRSALAALAGLLGRDAPR